MDGTFCRSELYWGENFQKFLGTLNIAVFGLGGVGGFALEALCRAGVGNFILVDFDTVSKTNINRQIIALNSTVGRKKTELFETRLRDINPNVNLKIFDDFYEEDLNSEIFSRDFDFVVDAIDSLRSKIALLKHCYINNIEVISSLGAGNRIDGSKLSVTDLSEIKTNCPFVKNIVSRLKKEGIESGMPIVWSKERPSSLKKVKTVEKIVKKSGEQIEITKFIPASTPVVPAISGYLCANYIINGFYEKFTKNNA